MGTLSCFLVSLFLLVSFVAGGVAGLGGWLGKVTRYFIWTVAAGDTFDRWPLVVCLSGVIYISLATVLSILGWQVARPRHRR